MGDIIQCNIRGLKTEHLRGEKVDLIVKVLAEQNTKILNLQETRLNSLSHIPKELLYYNYIIYILLHFVGLQTKTKEVES